MTRKKSPGGSAPVPTHDRERVIEVLRERLTRCHDDAQILVSARDLRSVIDGPEFTRGEVKEAILQTAMAAIGDIAGSMVRAIPPKPWETRIAGEDLPVNLMARRDALIHAGEDLYQAAREASAPTSPEREAGSWERLEYALADWRLTADGGAKP